MKSQESSGGRHDEKRNSLHPSSNAQSFFDETSSEVQWLEEQMNRIGRDLHDGICPDLTCIEMFLQSGMKHFPQSDSEKVKTLIELVSGVQAKIRKMAAGLTNTVIQESGLVDGLASWLNLIDSVSPIQITFQGPAKPVNHIDITAATHLYRIAQESVQNAIKHSKASIIHVELEVCSRDLVLVVKDDGVGNTFNGGFEKHGTGIRNMLFRSQLLHACLEFNNNQPKGVVVRCEVPSII